MQDKIASGTTPSLQDLIKEAGIAGLTRVSASEAARAVLGDPARESASEKTASASPNPTTDIEKIARACELAASALRKEAAAGPGEGGNALPISKTKMEGAPASSIEHGKARVQPPVDAPLAGARPNDAHNQIANNADHPAGKTAAEKSEEGKSKHGPTTGGQIASLLLGGPQGYLGYHKGAPAGRGTEGAVRGVLGYGLGAGPGALLGHVVGDRLGGGSVGGQMAGTALGSIGGGVLGYKALTHGVDKEAAAEIGASLRKVAYNAGDTANLGPKDAAPPSGTKADGQGSGHAGAPPTSAEGLRDLTKREAKTRACSDAAALVREPVHSAATDKVLAGAFAHTRDAGAKIASAADAPSGKGTIKHAGAARALLTKLIGGAT